MRRTLFLLLCALALSGPAQSQTGSQSVYVAKVRGITVGALRLTTAENGVGYAAAVLIESTGLVAIVRSFNFRGASRGTLRKGRPVPGHYEEDVNTGRRQSAAVIDYDRGVPRVTSYASTSAWGDDSPDPATQGDTVDPVTALFLLFRDQPVADLCKRTILMFDGKRRSHLVLGAPQSDGAQIHCAGEYRRLQGFTAEETARHVAFPMHVTYAPDANGLAQITHVEMNSVYGLATLDRR